MGPSALVWLLVLGAADRSRAGGVGADFGDSAGPAPAAERSDSRRDRVAFAGRHPGEKIIARAPSRHSLNTRRRRSRRSRRAASAATAPRNHADPANPGTFSIPSM